MIFRVGAAPVEVVDEDHDLPVAQPRPDLPEVLEREGEGGVEGALDLVGARLRPGAPDLLERDVPAHDGQPEAEAQPDRPHQPLHRGDEVGVALLLDPLVHGVQEGDDQLLVALVAPGVELDVDDPPRAHRRQAGPDRLQQGRLAAAPRPVDADGELGRLGVGDRLGEGVGVVLEAEDGVLRRQVGHEPEAAGGHGRSLPAPGTRCRERGSVRSVQAPARSPGA
jgi:hypothetical protein